VVYAGLNFGRFDDPAFGVIWLYWALLWALFFLVLGLKREELTRFTGAVAIVAGVFTAAVPAFMLLAGVWDDYLTTTTIVLVVICVLSLALYPRLREPRATAATAPAPELREGEQMYGDTAADAQQRAGRPSGAPGRRRR
jgi:asparagine N-glycosylation enzyme membrane subunit Stt3